MRSVGVSPGILFLVVIAFSIYRSTDGLKTLAYSAASIGGTILAFLLLGSLIPALDTAGVGIAAFGVSFLVGMLVGLVHSRRTRGAPLSKGEETQLQRWEDAKRRKSRF